MEQEDITNLNYNSISPSARSLLLLKGHTNIPFARQTAELLTSPNKYIPDFNNRDMTFWARVVHFENRYWSIDKLLEDLPIKNILELSSGFSFRSLETSGKSGFYYIDTDLPDVINLKKDFITALRNRSFSTEGKLELAPLNCLNEPQFHEIVSHFPMGEIVIVNEGLLMYLDSKEKENLCNIIHKILKERGGYWITADIYIKKSQAKLNLKIDDKTTDFFLKHNIEENKFNSYEEAESFFRRMGFIIDKEAVLKHSELSSIKYFLKSVTIKQLFKIRKTGKIQATWRLRVADVELKKPSIITKTLFNRNNIGLT
jgi:O-methyltransferase involved in polyketide biosynthesis